MLRAAIRARRTDRKSTRLNSSHVEIYTLSLHDALPISKQKMLWRRLFGMTQTSDSSYIFGIWARQVVLCYLAVQCHSRPVKSGRGQTFVPFCSAQCCEQQFALGEQIGRAHV